MRFDQMILAATMLVGCGGSQGTLVLVAVNSTVEFGDVAKLHAQASAGGRQQEFDVALATKTIPPEHTFGVQIPADVTGTFTIHVDAVTSQGEVAGYGDGAVELVVGKSVDLPIFIGPPKTDAGLLPNGSVCQQAAQCSSQFCIDGVCCGGTCDTACNSCAQKYTGQADGTCALVTVAGADPRGLCGGNGCSGNGTADCLVGDGEPCSTHAACRNHTCVGGRTCALCVPELSGYQFCWVNPYPQGNLLRDVVALSENEFLAVGEGGTILRYFKNAQGKDTWKMWNWPNWPSFSSICAVSDKDVYVVGNQGQLLHYDGSQWNQILSTVAFNNIACEAGGSVYAVGNNVQQMLLHPVGGGWSLVSYHSAGSGNPRGAAAWSFGSTETYVLMGNLVDGLQRFNGASFASSITGPVGLPSNAVPGKLWGRTVAGVKELYVSYSYSVYSSPNYQKTIWIYRYTSAPSTWKLVFTNVMTIPYASGEVGAMWGSASGKDLHVTFGFTSPYNNYVSPHLFYSSDITATPPVFAEITPADSMGGSLMAIAGFGASAFAVGLGGEIDSYSGTAWSRMGNTVIPPCSSFPTGVWGDDDTAYATGMCQIYNPGSGNYSSYGLTMAIGEADVPSWYKPINPDTAACHQGNAKIFGMGGTNGDIFITDVVNPNNTGCNSLVWSGEVSHKPANSNTFAPKVIASAVSYSSLNSIWGSGLDNLYVAGPDVYKYHSAAPEGWSSENAWATLDGGVADGSLNLNDVAGDSTNPSDVRAVGPGGNIYRSGAPWSHETLSMNTNIYVIWAYDGAWFAITDSGIFRTDAAGQWSDVPVYVPNISTNYLTGVKTGANSYDLITSGSSTGGRGLVVCPVNETGFCSEALPLDCGAFSVASLRASPGGTIWVGLYGQNINLIKGFRVNKP